MALTLKSRIFNKAIRQQVFSRIIRKTAREFREATKRGITNSNPTGRIYRRTRGNGFTRSHRASKRGETIANDSGNTVRNIKDRSISEFHSVVEVDTEYAEHLIEIDREIFADKNRAQVTLTKDLNDAIIKLL